MDVAIFSCDDYSITVSTGSIDYAWDRFARRVQGDAWTYCDYKSSRQGELSLYKKEGKNCGLEAVVADESGMYWGHTRPVLFETCEYQFAVQFNNLAETKNERLYPKFRHQLKSVGNTFKFYHTGQHTGILVGNIDFLNSPGKFSFAFEYTNREGYLCRDNLDFYVASPKLDTKKDLSKITALINEEYENYVFEYLTLTFSSLSLTKVERNNSIIWLSIFRNVVESYFSNVHFIMSKPNNRPQRKVYYDRPDRIRKWSQQQEERFKNLGTDADRYYFRNEVTENTINTRENRFVKYSLHVLGKKFREIFSEVGSLYKDMDNEELQQLEQYNQMFSRLESAPFFRKVGKFEGFRQESSILQQRSGYSQIYKAWLMLKSSLDLIDGKTDIGMKKIWELYEIWCFLVMKRLIAKVLGVDLTDDSRVTEDKSEMLNTIVKSEMNHVISFKADNRDVVTLEYQHTYNRRSKDGMKTTTTEQRPDIVVSITKPNGFVMTYLYDAKYRVQDDSSDVEFDEGVDIDVADYPLPDAINQMHRYRDAIYYAMKEDERPIGKEVIGGYILFPGRAEGDKVRDRYFFKSIETVNIGAFPLLPTSKGQTGDLIQSPLLEEHLRSILLEGSVVEHIKDSIPQKGLTYSIAPKDSGDLVLVGYCKEEQWKVTLKQKMYYVRVGLTKGSMRLLPGFEQCKYLLMYRDSIQELYKLSELTGPRLVMKDELEKRGFTPSHDYYLVFSLEDSKPIVTYVDERIGKVFKVKKRKNIYQQDPYISPIEELLQLEETNNE